MRNRPPHFSLLPLAAALAVTGALAAGSVAMPAPSGPTRTAAVPVAQTTTTTTSGNGSSGASGTTTASNTSTTGTNTTSTLATNGAIVTTRGVITTGIITDNALVAGGMNVNGELIGNPATAATELAGTTNFGIAESEVAQVGVATSAATDPAVRRELRKRQNLKRNGQLLYSIAPRTNVDRTWQTPDDGPTPALRTSP